MRFRPPGVHSAEWRVLGQIRIPYLVGGLDVHRKIWDPKMAIRPFNPLSVWWKMAGANRSSMAATTRWDDLPTVTF